MILPQLDHPVPINISGIEEQVYDYKHVINEAKDAKYSLWNEVDGRDDVDEDDKDQSQKIQLAADR